MADVEEQLREAQEALRRKKQARAKLEAEEAAEEARINELQAAARNARNDIDNLPEEEVYSNPEEVEEGEDGVGDEDEATEEAIDMEWNKLLQETLTKEKQAALMKSWVKLEGKAEEKMWMLYEWEGYLRRPSGKEGEDGLRKRKGGGSEGDTGTGYYGDEDKYGKKSTEKGSMGWNFLFMIIGCLLCFVVYIFFNFNAEQEAVSDF